MQASGERSAVPCDRSRSDSRESEHRFRLTNIDPNSLHAHAVAQTRGVRWEIAGMIELL